MVELYRRTMPTRCDIQVELFTAARARGTERVTKAGAGSSCLVMSSSHLGIAVMTEEAYRS